MNHARKTLSNRVILAELRGLDTIDKVKRLKPRSTILGVTPTLSLDWVYSYSELLIPSDISLSQGTIKKRVRSSSYKYF